MDALAPGLRESGYLVIVDPVSHFFRYATVARARGLNVLVLTSNGETCRAEEAQHARMDDDYSSADQIDAFLDYEPDGLASALKALAPYRGRIAGLVAGDEMAVTQTARIAEVLGFPYAAPEDALCQQIKSHMKARLVARGVPTARFEAIDSLAAALSAWERLGGDCMVKMVDYAMSYGVSRARSRDEVARAWATIEDRRKALQQTAPSEDTVVIEEFIGGREFSVEGYVQNSRVEILNFCEKMTHSNFMVLGHLIPARVDRHEDALLRTIARDCAVALGIRNAVFHAEVHLLDGKPYIIECAARPPGQYSVGVIKRVWGVDLVDINIDLACGRAVSSVQTACPNSWNAILALYSERTGFVRNTNNLSAMRALSECYALKCGVEAGDPVHGLETYRDVLGLAFLEAPDPDAIARAYGHARELARFGV